jgi:tetratricopeptide (TPR) repeat protein
MDLLAPGPCISLRRRVGYLLLLSVMIVVVPLAAQGDDSANSCLRAGLTLLRSGHLRQAEDEFRKSIKLSQQPAAYVLLGIAENGLADYDDAIAAFHSALELDPSSPAAHYNLALSLVRLRRDDEALGELETVVHLNPHFEPALYNLALLLQETGRLQESIRYLEDARAQQPSDAAVLVHLVQAYFGAGEKKKGIVAAREAVLDDSRGDLSARVGALLVDDGDYREAVPALEKGRTYAPGSASLAVYLAKAYIGSGQPSRAVELLTRFAGGSVSWEVHDLLGVAYQAAGQPLPASEALRRAILLKPDSARAHFDLGTLLLDRPGKASQQTGVQELQKAIHLDPRQPTYYETLGQWLLEKHKLAAASQLLQRGIMNAPPTAELYLMLAVAKIQLQGSPAARLLIARALALSPQDGPALHLLGKCYYLTGNYRHAARYFSLAARVSPQDGFFAYDTALALERANQVHQAIPYAEKSVQLDSGQAIYHCELGKLYAKADTLSAAIRELEACVRLNPQIVSPYYLLARTYRQMGKVSEANLWRQRLQKLQEVKDQE